MKLKYLTHKFIATRVYILIILMALLFSNFLCIGCDIPGINESTVQINAVIENVRKSDSSASFWMMDTIIDIDLSVKSDKFSVLIPVDRPSFGSFNYAGESIEIYVTPGKDFDISITGKLFNENLKYKYTGPGAVPNNYWASKRIREKKQQHEVMNKYKDDGENDFVSNIDDFIDGGLTFLESFASKHELPEDFIEIEKLRIELQRAYFMSYYVRYRTRKDSNFTVSKDFNPLRVDFDLNNEKLASVPYGMFVTHLMTLGREYLKSKDIDEFDLNEIMNFFESIISNKKVLDHAYLGIMYEAFRDRRVDDKDILLVNRFYKSCKDPYYIKWVTPRYTKYKARWDKLNSLDGRPLPNVEFEDIDGKTIALSDLKGNAVYIDVWASWCGPCMKELPHLEKLQDRYKGEKISFVSLSVDKDPKAWKKMVAKKEIKGIQLICDKAFKSYFCKDMVITSIPRFILLDHKGIIVNANAPRPSSEEIKPLINEILTKFSQHK